MTELHLSRERCGTAQLRLPADVSVYQEALDHQGENGGPAGTLTITHVSSPVESLSRYLVYTSILDFSDLSRLNALAEKVDSMSQQERWLFSGALDTESVGGLDDILRIADSLDRYEIIEGVTSDRGLGGWLVENDQLDVDIPKDVRPYLDYAAIGAGYYSDHGGAYTVDGYVKRRDDAPEQAERAGTMLLTFKTPARNYPLVLPAAETQLEYAKRTLGIEDFSQTVIDSVEYVDPYLDRLIPMGCITVEDANEMALCLQRLKTDDEMKKYCAALEVEEPSTFSEALDMAMDIDDYELVSDNEREYGREALRRIGADDELLDAIDGYTDFDQLGRAMMEEDGARQSGYGLVRRLSKPFPEPEIGQTMM